MTESPEGASSPYYLPRKDDVDVETLLAWMEELAKLGAVVFVKWTCAKCGERVISDVPNTLHDAGYLHTEKKDGSPCGAVYVGKRFGLAVVLPIDPKLEADPSKN